MSRYQRRWVVVVEELRDSLLTDIIGWEQEVDELVEDWTPEPLVAKVTPFEEAVLEKRPVIVGYVNP